MVVSLVVTVSQLCTAVLVLVVAVVAAADAIEALAQQRIGSVS